jgi:hypothetical protein
MDKNEAREALNRLMNEFSRRNDSSHAVRVELCGLVEDMYTKGFVSREEFQSLTAAL